MNEYLVYLKCPCNINFRTHNDANHNPDSKILYNNSTIVVYLQL